jgi:hypothetical protein
MKVTLDIDDALYAQIEALASVTGRSVPVVIEEALRLMLSDSAKARKPIDLPRSKETGWVHPGIDIIDARAVREILG